MRLIRVFPRRTKATPDDELARFGPPGLFDEADEVHVSVTFTYDKIWKPEKPSQEKWRPGDEWRGFQRRWARPAIIHAVKRPPQDEPRPPAAS